MEPQLDHVENMPMQAKVWKKAGNLAETQQQLVVEEPARDAVLVRSECLLKQPADQANHTHVSLADAGIQQIIVQPLQQGHTRL